MRGCKKLPAVNVPWNRAVAMRSAFRTDSSHDSTESTGYDARFSSADTSPTAQ
jgi:hypothetical protein